MSSRNLDTVDRPRINRSKTPTGGSKSPRRNSRNGRSKTPTSGKKSPRGGNKSPRRKSMKSGSSPRRGSKSPRDRRHSTKTRTGVSGSSVKRRVEQNRQQREKERQQRQQEREERLKEREKKNRQNYDDDDDNDNDEDEEKDVVTPLKVETKKSGGGFLSKFGFGSKKSNDDDLTELRQSSPYSNLMKEVQGVAVFVNSDQMILRGFCDDVFENAFKAATNIDFKTACLELLESNKSKKIYTIDDPYTMWSSTIGDKDIVFLMVGEHDPYPTVESLHQTILSLFGSLKVDSNQPKHKRTMSKVQRTQTLQGLSSIQEVFQMMDLDGGGTIDEAEFSTGLFSLGVEWDNKQISRLFNEIDEKDEGSIAFSDFMKFMMKPNNKREWKELKRAIQKSIDLPTARDLKNDGVDVVRYQKKLSSCEKLIDMLEELVYETLDKQKAKYWGNKISAHREFIRRHQDVVGKAMGMENVRLKKRLSQLEDQTKRLKELEKLNNQSSPRGSIGGTPKSRRSSYNVNRENEDKDTLIKRLRRENQEMKRKVNSQEKEIKQMELQQSRRPSSVRLRRQSTQQNNDNLTDIIAKLRAENRELRKERDELRSEKSQLQTQLQTANDKIRNMSKNTGVDDHILNQLTRLKQESSQLRNQRNMLRDEAIKLKGVDNALRKKLSTLAKKLANIDQKLASGLRGKESLNDMLEELVDQLDGMTDRYNAAQTEISKLRQELRDQARKHREELDKLKQEIKRLKKLLREKESNIIIIKQESKDKDKMINDLKDKLRETERLYNEAKNVRRELGDKQDEIDDLKSTITKLRKELSKEMNEKKKYRQQLQLISKMPGNASLLRQIGRLHQIFDRLDTNKDGRLSFEEFEKGAEELGFGDNLFDQQEAFNKMDKDNDSYVIYDDFEEACLKLLYDQQDNDDNNWRTLHNLLSKPPNKWNIDDVSKWLEHIGMGQYVDNFRNGNVDGKRLLELKQRDLKDLGVVKIGHQRKILNNLKDLLKRDDLLSNLKYENEELKSELDYMKENGPTWSAVRHLQTRIRDLEGDLRKEKHERENILNNVRDELENSKQFQELKDNDKKDLLSEIALLKGALSNERMMIGRRGYDPDNPNGFSNVNKHYGNNYKGDPDDPNGFSNVNKHYGNNYKGDPDNPNGYSNVNKHYGNNYKNDPDNPNGYSNVNKHYGNNYKGDPDNPNGYSNVNKHYGNNYKNDPDNPNGFKSMQKHYGNNYKKSDIVDHGNNKIVGRFLQKWYVLANHQTQYWVSRTNEELDYFKEQYEKIHGLELSKEGEDDSDDNNNNENKENDDENEDNENKKEPTEIMDWIVYDTRRERIVHEVRMKGRGMKNDPKDVKIELSVSPSGPWTTVAKTSLKKSDKTQRVTGFAAKGRFWRVCMLNNHGESHPQAPRYVMYEVQFWGPLDEDVQNSNFVIE